MEFLGWDSKGLCWLLESGKLWGRREALEGERERNKERDGGREGE